MLGNRLNNTPVDVIFFFFGGGGVNMFLRWLMRSAS